MQAILCCIQKMHICNFYAKLYKDKTGHAEVWTRQVRMARRAMLHTLLTADIKMCVTVNIVI